MISKRWKLWRSAILLRLLDAAVNYRETHDQRVLLRLAMEERKVWEQMLGEVSPETA